MNKALEIRVERDGVVADGEILKVDSFINHQVDPSFLNLAGREFFARFKNEGITKILTIEASGIAIAAIAAQYFDVPFVFAKKMESLNLDPDTFETDVFSYTKGKGYKVRVAKKFLTADDKILILDDFLARGEAALGLVRLCRQAGAKVGGIGILIEKSFQEGAGRIEQEDIRLESLVRIAGFEDGKVIFKQD
ncbi:xanthine phosphoribosyltransferase [Gottschalkiaceae bacterium SANA]|nr:xanthine phosphoribosyltransferase [Gottschalkiaceae bacterium SANA]